MFKCLLAPAASGVAAASEASGFSQVHSGTVTGKFRVTQDGIRVLQAGEQGSALAGRDVDNGYSAFGVCSDAIICPSCHEASFWVG
jgi:hypothetical protein